MSFKHIQNVHLQARWDLINEMVALVKQERLSAGQAIDAFKIDRHQFEGYLATIAQRNYLASVNDLIESLELGSFENSIIILGEKTILMDHHSGDEDYNIRYAGQGKFGKVKQGIDQNGKLYAIKVERKRDSAISERERKIMERAGNLIGTLYRDTSTANRWIDNNPIKEKEMTIMPWCEGKQLKHFDKESLKREYPHLCEREVDLLSKMIALRVVNAIHFLNKMGIVHRDINPENFLVDINHLPTNLSEIDMNQYLQDNDSTYQFSKLVTVLDFGLAMEVPHDGSSVSFLESEFQATNTTAPEYFTDVTCSVKSDVFQMVLFLRNFFGIRTFPLDGKVTDNSLPYHINNYAQDFSNLQNHRVILNKTLENINKVELMIKDEEALPEKNTEKLVKMHAYIEAMMQQSIKLEGVISTLLAKATQSMETLKLYSERFKPENRPSLREYYEHLRNDLIEEHRLLMNGPVAASSSSEEQPLIFSVGATSYIKRPLGSTMPSDEEGLIKNKLSMGL